MKKNTLLHSLNGDWFYVTDPNSILSYDETKRIFLNENLPNMKLPANWQVGGLDNYSGTVWFVKKFDLLNSDFNLKILEFNGVDYFTSVWLNDEFVGCHEGYFQKFFFDVSHLVKPKENLLIVKVTSPKEDTENDWPHRKKLIKGIFNHHDCRPGGWSKDYGQDRNTGGIWNNVNLYLADTVYISNVKVFSKIFWNDNYAIINFEIDYTLPFNSSQPVKLHYSIELDDNSIVDDELLIERNRDSKTIITVKLNEPSLWYPYEIGEPTLYKLIISDSSEKIFEKNFGIREIQLIDDIFYINRKRLFLRGTNIIPEQNLSTFTEDRINNLVVNLKEANVNIVRVHAHVNRQELYDAFDREGILVWQDFALQWTYDESEKFISKAASQIKDMVRQFHYHPSIVFWCCHNEPGEQINVLDEFLYDAVISEDTSRIVRKASNYEEHCYEGWYWGKMENYVATPMGPFVTEFGAQALPSKETLISFIPESALNNPEKQIWEYHNFQFEQTFHIAKIEKGNSIEDFVENSQSYQAELLKTAIHFYRRKKYQGISGIFQFMFIDCWESITWSVIDYFGKKKKGFFALKNAFNPLLLSVDLRQNVYSNLSKKLNIELWIINDYHKEFNNLSVKFFLDEIEIYSLKVDSVAIDSIIKYDFENLNVKLPENLVSGIHRLKVELRDNESKLISFETLNLVYKNV